MLILYFNHILEFKILNDILKLGFIYVSIVNVYVLCKSLLMSTQVLVKLRGESPGTAWFWDYAILSV